MFENYRCLWNLESFPCKWSFFQASQVLQVKLASKADSQCLGQWQIWRQSAGKVHMSGVGSYWWNKKVSKIKVLVVMVQRNVGGSVLSSLSSHSISLCSLPCVTGVPVPPCVPPSSPSQISTSSFKLLTSFVLILPQEEGPLPYQGVCWDSSVIQALLHAACEGAMVYSRKGYSGYSRFLR